MSMHKHIHGWILVSIFTGMVMMTSVECHPMSNKAAGWMSTVGEDDRSYSHLGGDSKFAKGPLASQPPRSVYQSRSASGSTSNKTLAAILVLTVFGLGATALLAIICSKMSKKENYDSMNGTIY